MLSEAANTDLRHEVVGTTVAEALGALFESKPGLRNHILDDAGQVRPHVSMFVGGVQSDLSTSVPDGAEIRVLHAVSGGCTRG